MKDIIHVGFPLHDVKGIYSKYEAVALLSLLSNTSSEILVHIIHDSSVSNATKAKFRKLCNVFDQQIEFHEVNTEDFLSLSDKVKTYTIGTLFRLQLPEILDDDIEKILFLDADLLVNTDIRKIWEKDVSGYYVAACHDEWLCDLDVMMAGGLVPASKYYNAGVVVFNLKEIRQNFNLYEDSVDFLLSHNNCPLVDQDAANYFFLDNVLYLEQKYNMFTKKRRGAGLPLEEGIYHYAGDYCNPVKMEAFDRLFYHYLYVLQDEQWLTEHYINFLQDNYKQLILCHEFIRRVTGTYKKKVYWGANSVSFSKVIDIVSIDALRDYIVDSNVRVQGNEMFGMTVYSPQKLFAEKKGDCVILVTSMRHYSEIKNDLELNGFVENEDFFDGIKLLPMFQGGYGKYY